MSDPVVSTGGFAIEHFIYRLLRIAKLAQNLAGMLADFRRGAVFSASLMKIGLEGWKPSRPGPFALSDRARA
jgi:hypothetical protein